MACSSEDREQRGIRDESVVPLINVVFLLLIFFLLVGTLAPAPDLEVEMAETAASPASDPPVDALYVSAEGAMSYRGNPVALEDFAATFAAVGTEGPGAATRGAAAAPLKVVLDRTLTASAISPVVDALANAGVTRVELITARSRAP